MPTQEKAGVIDELAEQLGRAKLAILTDYRGLDVTGLQGLRSTLRPFNAEFRVAKNTLTRIAAERAGIDGLTPMLDGPLALVLAFDDIVGPSKAVSDFARTSRILTVKGAVLDNQIISAKSVEDLATMPSREELLGKLLGLFNSPVQGLVNVLSGPSRSFVQVLNAYAEQQGGGAAEAA
ncbi:MAG: 50S ribosomal protein L10 [Chloroflexota bacterium]|nr:50S ribosomal protein L10 [Chloroflexota bacterium]